MCRFFQIVRINSRDIFGATLFGLMKTIIKSLVNENSYFILFVCKLSYSYIIIIIL